MKNMLKRMAVASMLFVGVSAGQAATITYSIDFGATGTPATTGYTIINANFLADTMVNVTGISGIGGAATINFAINHVGVYSAGNAAEPLITDGIYTFGNGANDHTFTLSGLNAGDQVSIYAVSGWDGNGRGATLVFGGSTTVAQVVGDPGTAPTLANYTLINSTVATADGTGILTGTMLGHDGTPADEGQMGGMVIVVTSAVPEPSTYALLGMGVVSLFAFRRFRGRKA